MNETGADYLTLADWRRRIAQLYVEVRNLQRIYGPEAAHQQWRQVREDLYRTHPQSPVPVDRRGGFTARHFPYDTAWRFEAVLVPDDAETAEQGGFTVPTSSGGPMGVRRIGRLDVPFPSGERRMGLYWLEGYAGGLFLSFRDGTNGVETYGGGRYLLDASKSADLGGDPVRGTLVLDFNFAYHPSCAFDPRWVCPLVPPENVLDMPVNAGERLA